MAGPARPVIGLPVNRYEPRYEGARIDGREPQAIDVPASPPMTGQDTAGSGIVGTPPVFAEIVGQPTAVAALVAAARHPVHAYLFRGSGSSTRAAAQAFAAALLCRAGGCGACAECRRVATGSHPDVVLVERSGPFLGIDEARRLVLLAQRRPLEASRQVLVVADVHLAARSVPALLKTVEEPPPATVFVLLAEDVPPELATVASRCVEVRFPPVALRTVVEWLVGRGVDHDRAVLVAEGCGGDLDRAKLLAADESYLGRVELWRSVPSRLDGSGSIAGELARSLLDATEQALVPLRDAHRAQLEALAEEAKELGERGVAGRKQIVDRQHREERRYRVDELRHGLGVLARAYRDRLADVVGSRATPDPVEAQRFETAVAHISAAAAALHHNPNELLLLESLLVRLGAVGT